jgi:cholesterol transport system auxiliary component
VSIVRPIWEYLVLRRLGRHSRLWLPARAPALTFALGLTLVLGGCAGGLGGGLGGLGGKSPPTAYDLDAVHDFPRHGRSARGQLAIAEPVALAVYDGDKIVVRPSPGEAAVMAGVQWQDRLPKLMQARILQSFENDGRLRAVGRPADKIASDYVLTSEIRAFEISVSDHSAVVEIAAKIVGDRSGRIVAARVFRATMPLDATDGAPAIAALDDAFGKVTRELVLWTTRRV